MFLYKAISHLYIWYVMYGALPKAWDRGDSRSMPSIFYQQKLLSSRHMSLWREGNPLTRVGGKLTKNRFNLASFSRAGKTLTRIQTIWNPTFETFASLSKYLMFWLLAFSDGGCDNRSEIRGNCHFESNCKFRFSGKLKCHSLTKNCCRRWESLRGLLLPESWIYQPHTRL